ncbi:MAG TPA: succinate dehydrogenase/fumarate reductase iron-sulfur subunit [Chthoniobacteraceae bacterium]|jgi:succinate dehydrogenase / fumarate reductase iron-sulfur subunit|nr:succinate dehydrogenase/fumarate reductase iron-sulfur subunit [Chthoniobacteraceae bacterium]
MNGPAKRNYRLRVWRQKSGQTEGKFSEYEAKDIPADASFLEMLDIVNEGLVIKNEEPVAFDHDCREGICGMCSLVINGTPHGPNRATTTCQLYMRHFRDGQTITIEPFRAGAFPVLKDLIVNRSALDRIQQAGGFISVRTGSAQDANNLPVSKQKADLAMDAAACIQCGACVAACPNASAMLFLAARVSHFALLPQGQPERESRVLKMLAKHDEEGFGNCRNHYECEAVCPAEIPALFITKLNREYVMAETKNAVAGHK